MKSWRWISSLFFLLLCHSTSEGQVQVRYRAIYEPALGMNFGAENIASTHFLWQTFDNQFIPNQLFKSDTSSSKWGNRAYRLGKWFLLDYPIAFILPSLQHEYFGHGTRARQWRGRTVLLKITLPPPFQIDLPGIGYEIPGRLSTQEQSMMAAAGSEANTILGNVLRKNMLLQERIDHHQAFLYLYSNNDLSGYTTFAAGLTNGDISVYIGLLNNHYPDQRLSVERLKTYALLSILTDPINYLAFYSIFKGYLFDGKNNTKLPLISLGKNRLYLPKFRFVLTPYGPELIYQQYLKIDQALYNLTFGHSDGTFANSWRLGIDAWNLKLGKKFTVGSSTQIWWQPEISYYQGRTMQTYRGWGGLVVGTIQYDLLTWQNIWGAILQVGYKSAGFMEGEGLESQLIFRAGLTFQWRQAEGHKSLE